MATKTNVEEKELTIKWMMLDEKVVRFVEIEKACNLSEEMAKLDFSKAGIAEGSKVSVKLEQDGENQVVTFLSLAKGEKPQTTKAEPKKEEAKAPETTPTPTASKRLTIRSISISNKGLVFREEENVWYTVDSSITMENFGSMGIEKGTLVEITTRPPEGRSKNHIITSIVVPKDAPKETAKTETKRSYNDYANTPDKQQSIEAQGAVERAYSVIASMVRGATPDKVKPQLQELKSIARELALDAYKLVQDLKKS